MKLGHAVAMSSLLDLFTPSECLICSSIGLRVCKKCSATLSADARMVIRGNLVGFAAAPYNQEVRKVLRSFKELGESSLAKTLAGPMASLLGCIHGGPITITPIPGNRTSTLERGYNPPEVLAREIGLLVPSVEFLSLLRKTRSTLDQSKLKPGERIKNQANSVVSSVGQRSVVIIDDIVTTGATIRAAAEALESAGHTVLGFITFAETELKKV